MNDPAFVARNLLDRLEEDLEEQERERDRETTDTPRSRKAPDEWELGSDLKLI